MFPLTHMHIEIRVCIYHICIFILTYIFIYTFIYINPLYISLEIVYTHRHTHIYT